jgi:hypothetical protein
MKIYSLVVEIINNYDIKSLETLIDRFKKGIEKLIKDV